MNFQPELCRNESEVESKLIVQYLLPKLGYSPDTWHQEVTFGSIRLDFLVFATQVVPFVLDSNSPLTVVMEAKHPNQNLNNHICRLKRYLTSLNVSYGLLTNGKEIRIYQRIGADIQLVLQCLGQELEVKIDEIKALIGRESLKENSLQSEVFSNGNDNSGSILLPGIIESEPNAPTTNLPKSDATSANLPKSDVTTTSSPQAQPLADNQNIPQNLDHPNSEPQRHKRVKIIAVYHNKGGVGKTTTVVNLAAAIRKTGKRVLVIDLDSQANTTFATGLVKFDDEEFDNIKDCNIRHLLESEDFYPISEVAQTSSFTNPAINVIPAHISLMKYENELNQNEASKTMLIQKLENVKNEYDIVLIDTPPSLNLYARIAIITADYLLIPSDLKPFANQGLINVKEFIKSINNFKKMLRQPPIEVLGVLACKISTNAKFIQHTLPKRLAAIPERYGLDVLETVIYERDDLAKCAEKTRIVGNMEIADPISVLDFKPDSMAAREFELLGKEVLKQIGMA
ncbi:MAG: AAA family ATPase [Symploca sp. SIO2E6]|nr:AAA family ATPase [Symploca sp. SIO2E6]